jgi:H+/Cl- antiporter ClcA
MISRRKLIAGIATGIAAVGVGGYYAFKPGSVEIAYALTESEPFWTCSCSVIGGRVGWVMVHCSRNYCDQSSPATQAGLAQ